METAESLESPEKDDRGILFVRRFPRWTAIASFALMCLCLAGLTLSKALRLDMAATGMLFQSLYAGALGFFISASARFSLDIMYGILGLAQVRIAAILAWVALAAASLISLALIFALQRLASGFQS